MNIQSITLKQYDDAPEDLVVFTCDMKNVVDFFNNKGIRAKFVDDSSVNPARAVVEGVYFNIEYYSHGMDRIYGESSNVYCDVTYKNGDVALRLNNFDFPVTSSSELLENMIYSYYLINKDKLEDYIIHNSSLTKEQLERMQNNGFLKSRFHESEEVDFSCYEQQIEEDED